MAGACCKGMPMEQRKQPRLEHYDYTAPGMYFVTICTENRRNLLSKVCRGDPCGRPPVALLPLGEIAEQVFEKVEKLYGVEFDCRVIMPNHIHFIVSLSGERATARVAPTLGNVVGAYKSIAANEWRKYCQENNISAGTPWQRNYYEHVIRNEQDLFEVRNYIQNNPLQWQLDELYSRQEK